MSMVFVRGIARAAAVLAWGACAASPRALPSPSPGPVAAGPVTYAPGATQYRRASHRHIEQQVGGQTQRTDEALVCFVSATLARQGDRLTVSLTLDSVPRYQSDPSAAGAAERARGATFTGELAPNGQITAFSGGDPSNKLLQQLADELARFYPRIPPTGAEPGARWTDTTQTTSKTGGLPLTMVAVSQHQAEAPADSGAERTLPIRTLTTYSFSGSGSQGGQVYLVQGEGRRHTVERLTLGGRFFGMIAADTSSYTISLRGLDVSIPGRQTRADTLSIIP